MNDMHTKIPHDTDLTAGFDLAFPVDRFGAVQVTGVVETGADFKDLSELIPLSGFNQTLRSREERKLRTEAHETSGAVDGFCDFNGGGQINAERTFSQ